MLEVKKHDSSTWKRLHEPGQANIELANLTIGQPDGTQTA
jgi:hypothetical protein